LIKEISRKFPDTRKIEVRNNTSCPMFVRSVVTAEGNIYLDINEFQNPLDRTEFLRPSDYVVLPIEDVDY